MGDPATDEAGTIDATGEGGAVLTIDGGPRPPSPPVPAAAADLVALAKPLMPATEMDAAALEAGRKLFAGRCQFFYAAQRLDQLPEPRGPEVAFAGRSNAGKSSLVNALTGQKALARASHTPGRTKQLNFFDLGGRLILVDMPGYGYAQAGKAVKRDWQGLMFDYLRGRVPLRRVVLLLDARIELKVSDRTVMELFDKAAVSYQLVLTKADDVTPATLTRRLRDVTREAKGHAAAFPDVVATSSRSGLGMEVLRAQLALLGEQG